MLKEFVTVSLAVALGVVLIMIMMTGYDIFHKLSVRDSYITEYEFVDEVNYDKNQVNGGDVIGWIRYFNDKSDVTVSVTNESGNRIYDGSTYDSGIYVINPFDTYDITYEFDENSALEKLNCIRN